MRPCKRDDIRGAASSVGDSGGVAKPGIGQPCSFYHQGGAGKRMWVIGWRYGIIRAIPSKGRKLGLVQIEIKVPRWDFDPLKKAYTPRPNERVWVPATDVNEAGDTLYHGPKATAVWKEHQEEKAEQQAKADKKKAARRFTRA